MSSAFGMEKKLMLTVCALMCVLAVVSSAASDGKKRGIIVKCQGNPVSCYGKRSSSSFGNSDLDMSPSRDEMDENSVASPFRADEEFEKTEAGEMKEQTLVELFKSLAHKLHRNCLLGVRPSCDALKELLTPF